MKYYLLTEKLANADLLKLEMLTGLSDLKGKVVLFYGKNFSVSSDVSSIPAFCERLHTVSEIVSLHSLALKQARLLFSLTSGEA